MRPCVTGSSCESEAGGQASELTGQPNKRILQTPKPQTGKQHQKTSQSLHTTDSANNKIPKERPSNMNIYSDIWLGFKWFFCDFCIQMLTAPFGILKDVLDICGLSWRIFCLGIGFAGTAIALIIRYIKNRL